MRALDDSGERAALWQAWLESGPDTPNPHEEGGFVLLEADGRLSVERWPQGGQDRIEFSGYASGLRRGRPIVATFHTHPNPAPEYRQEPSRTDIRAVRDDADLQHSYYEGELVIAREATYPIHSDGQVLLLGRTMEVLTGSVNRPQRSGG